MLSTRSKRSARWSVQSDWRAAQLTVRNATRKTVMLPRSASVREKTSSSSSSGSDEDIGMWIRTNCNSFPCLLERAAFCLRNAPHQVMKSRWMLVNIRTDQVKVKKRAVVRRCVCVCVWYLSAHRSHDPHARLCNAFDAHSGLRARLNTLTGSSALTSLSGPALAFLMHSELTNKAVCQHQHKLYQEFVENEQLRELHKCQWTKYLNHAL